MKREEVLEIYNCGPEAIITHVKKQDELIAQLEARIAELEARLNQNSRNSSRPPSTDVFIKPKSQRKKGERPVGGQKGHPGHTLEMMDNPDETVPCKASKCDGCGESLEDVPVIDVERRQAYNTPPLKIIVTEYQAEHKQCPHCGCHNRGKYPQSLEPA